MKLRTAFLSLFLVGSLSCKTLSEPVEQPIDAAAVAPLWEIVLTRYRIMVAETGAPEQWLLDAELLQGILDAALGKEKLLDAPADNTISGGGDG